MMQYKILFFLLLFWSSLFAQNENKIFKVKQITVVCWGDSIIPQDYELNLHTKKIYFRSPFLNYSDIKGEKLKKRVRFKKKKTKIIFDYLEIFNFYDYRVNKKRLDKETLYREQSSLLKSVKMFYTFGVLYSNDDYYEYTFTADNVPIEIKKLYTIITAK